VHQLLDAVEQGLALLRIQLAGLIPEERVDIGIANVDEGFRVRG
jgi:hypothetical protein